MHSLCRRGALDKRDCTTTTEKPQRTRICRTRTRSASDTPAQHAQSDQVRLPRHAVCYYDHREAPADADMSDADSLYRGLLEAYGASSIEAGGWVDLKRIREEIWDPATDPQDA